MVGTPEWTDVAWRDAFASGAVVGPRLFCCGHGLRTTAGHDPSGGTSLMRAADGAAGMVQAVRNEIQHATHR